jgi:hypothetical protein
MGAGRRAQPSGLLGALIWITLAITRPAAPRRAVAQKSRQMRYHLVAVPVLVWASTFQSSFCGSLGGIGMERQPSRVMSPPLYRGMRKSFVVRISTRKPEGLCVPKTQTRA